MKHVISIAGALILLGGLSVAAVAWLQLSSEKADLAAEVAALRQANTEKIARLQQTIADQKGSLHGQELEYATKLRELASRDSELNAFLKKLLEDTAAVEDAADSAPEHEPVPTSAVDASQARPPEPEIEALEEPDFTQRQQLTWEDDHNADGVIDETDVAIVHDLAGQVSQEGDEGFDPGADLDGDGVISINDSIGLWKLLQQHGQANQD